MEADFCIRQDLIAAACSNAITASKNLEMHDEALEFSQNALDIWDNLVNEHGRSEIEPDLAAAYARHGNSLDNMNRTDEVLPYLEKSQGMLEKLVYEKGRSDQLQNLALVYGNIASAWRKRDQFDRFLEVNLKGIQIQEEFLEKAPSNADICDLYIAMMFHRGEVLIDLAKPTEALGLFSKAVIVLEQSVFDYDHKTLIPFLCIAKAQKIILSHQLGTLEEDTDGISNLMAQMKEILKSNPDNKMIELLARLEAITQDTLK